MLVACLLTSAAQAVGEGDLTKAEENVERALRYDGEHADARRFKDALGFARNLSRLDLKKLDTAVTQCERSYQAGDHSAQFVRSLGVLYHRVACQSEQRRQDPQAAWQKCLEFWQSQIFRPNAFWSEYETAYNAGRGRREMLKSASCKNGGRRYRPYSPASM